MNHREQLKNKYPIRLFMEERAIEIRDLTIYFLRVLSKIYDILLNIKAKLYKNRKLVLQWLAFIALIGIFCI